MAETNPMTALQAELARFRKASLHSAVNDADKILEMLIEAREQVANGSHGPRYLTSCLHAHSLAASDPHRASLTVTKLQNPVTAGFEAINNDLKEVSKSQKVFGKALDKVGVDRSSSVVHSYF